MESGNFRKNSKTTKKKKKKIKKKRIINWFGIGDLILKMLLWFFSCAVKFCAHCLLHVFHYVLNLLESSPIDLVGITSAWQWVVG